MGFGGGNGFSPSRTVVEDSTKTGNDASQKHQFTGSVEISGGPLKLDGASITPGGGGGGTPGGSDTQVQYNDGGAFGGDAQFFYNDSTDSLTVGGKLMVGAASTPAYLCHLTSSGEVTLTLQGPGDVGIRLAADRDGTGVDENDNPYIDFYQDGQQPTSRNNRLATIAMVGEDDAVTSFTGSLQNALFLDAFCPSPAGKHSNVRRFQIATDCKFNKWNDQASPRQGSHTVRMSIEGERGFMAIGDNNAPTAVLHVSSSQGTPLFRVDHTGTLGPEPILFVTGSGMVGMGTDTPLTNNPVGDGSTNRLHIIANGVAPASLQPIQNAVLTLENSTNHVALQMLVGNNRAGQIVYGNDIKSRLATSYFDTNFNRFNWEGLNPHKDVPIGYGDSRVFTVRASGDSINMGQINSDHQVTDVASLHISSSASGNLGGGPVLLQVDHFDQPGGEPTLFVTGSGRVGIGTNTPTQALDVGGTVNATALAIGGTAISSTAAELNLLDASTVTAPAEGVWAGVERVAVLDIGASEYSVAQHTLGVTIPDKAIITRAILDVGTAFTSAGTPTLGLETTGNRFPEPGASAAQIDFFANLGGSDPPNVPSALLAAQYSTELTFPGGKLNGASTVTFTVAGANPFTTGAAKVYIYYIMGS
mgnify:CR=1 FL=1